MDVVGEGRVQIVVHRPRFGVVVQGPARWGGGGAGASDDC
jgi:hypothetical protein